VLLLVVGTFAPLEEPVTLTPVAFEPPDVPLDGVRATCTSAGGVPRAAVPDAVVLPLRAEAASPRTLTPF
jgi:hypothetical protein